MSNSNNNENFKPINKNIKQSMTNNQIKALMNEANALGKSVNNQNKNARKLINKIKNLNSSKRTLVLKGGKHKKHTRKHKKHTRKH